MNFLIIVIVLAKFLLPVLLLVSPFFAGWANFILDTIDGDVLIPLGLADPQYQLIDKAADYVTYIFMLIVGWRWQIRKEILITFLIRTVGQALFFISGNELVFFFFPNFLEPLFLIYASLLFIKKDDAYNIYKKYRYLIWGFILVYKMQDEYITHVANIDRSELFKRLFGK